MSIRQHPYPCVIAGVDGAPIPMPESLLLRRLSFTFISAVETFTRLLLSCESHIPHSPRSRSRSRSRSPRPSRKRALPMTPASPTSITGHVSSPISLLDVEDHLNPSLFEEKSTSRRKRTSRSHNPTTSAATPGRRPKNSSSSKTDKFSRHPSRLPRRNAHSKPKKHDPQVQPRERQEKRMRTSVRRVQQTGELPNERLAFMQPPASKLSGLRPWRHHHDTVQRVVSLRSQRMRPQPPVAPIALPPTIRQVPRGTLTSFLTSDETTLSLGMAEGRNPVTPDGTLLEQGIRPSRRVRFAQNVQLVC